MEYLKDNDVSSDQTFDTAVTGLQVASKISNARERVATLWNAIDD